MRHAHHRREKSRVQAPARERLFRHSQPVGRGDGALSAGHGLQGAGDDERGLCLGGGGRRRRHHARPGDQAHRRIVGRGLGAHERRFRGRLCRCARGRGGKRAAVRGNRRVRPVDRGLHRRQGQAALRLRSGGGAHQGGARGHRQGRRRCAADRAQRGLHPRQARHGRDHSPAQGLFRRRAPIASTRRGLRRASRFRPW